jgi:diadenosine tetraphosphate (Ap4A) HIT family hydrolase
VSADCIFCRVAAGREPASFVYRDSQIVAFMSNAPVNAGHLLVIPHDHVTFFADLAPNLAAKLVRAAQRVALALRGSELRCEGINLFLADGDVASQLVPHVHLHVIPRFAGDTFKLNSRGGVSTFENMPPREELDRAAAAIRVALSNRDHR